VQRPDICPWDNALVLRDKRRRRSAGRGELSESRIFDEGIEIAYDIQYGGLRVAVRSTVIGEGEFEARIHRVIAPPGIDPGMELAEGSSALGFVDAADVDSSSTDKACISRHKKSGILTASWAGREWAGIGAAWDFGSDETVGSNVVYPRFYVNTLWAPLKPGVQILSSVHYASPKPMAQQAFTARAQALFARLRGIEGGSAPIRRSTAGGSKTKPAKGRP
jgi:hypothetical protein